MLTQQGGRLVFIMPSNVEDLKFVKVPDNGECQCAIWE